MRKTVSQTVQRRFRVELTKNDLLTMMRTHDGSRLFPPDTLLPERNNQIEISVDGTSIGDTTSDFPLTLEWTTTEVSEGSNG